MSKQITPEDIAALAKKWDVFVEEIEEAISTISSYDEDSVKHYLQDVGLIPQDE